MHIIRNSYIPFRGFTAMNLLGVLFVRREAAELTPETLNHEKIHSAQMREMLYIPFYIWYLLEWLLRLFLVVSEKVCKGSILRRSSLSLLFL